MAPTTHTPAWAVGMQKIGPGVYRDGGAIHISEAQICEHFGVPYTARNVRTIEAALKDVLKELGHHKPHL